MLNHMLHSYTVRRLSRNTAEVLGVISMISGKVVGGYLVFDYNCARLRPLETAEQRGLQSSAASPVTLPLSLPPI